MSDPRYDVVIPVHNRAELTTECLASLATVAEPLRVLLVDNGSEVDQRRIVREALVDYGLEHRWIQLDSNTGHAHATNVGMHASTAPYLVLLNNDTLVYPHTFAEMAAACDAGQGHLAGPVSSSGWQAWGRLGAVVAKARSARTEEQRAELLHQHYAGRHIEVPTRGQLAFFCAMMPRRVYFVLGHMDESYPGGFGADDDYCMRARDFNFGLRVALGAYCYHHHRTTFRDLHTSDAILAMQRTAARKFRARWGRNP